MTPASSKTQIIWLEDRVNGLEKRLEQVERLNKSPNKCAVKNCKNHRGEGKFYGLLCAPCHLFVCGDGGLQSQVYRNMEEVYDLAAKPLTDEEIIETCATWVIDDIGSNEVIKIVRRTELAHGIGGGKMSRGSNYPEGGVSLASQVIFLEQRVRELEEERVRLQGYQCDIVGKEVEKRVKELHANGYKHVAYGYSVKFNADGTVSFTPSGENK